MDVVVHLGTTRAGWVGVGAGRGRMHLLAVMGRKVVSCLSTTILTTIPFAGISIMVRRAIENGWRVGILASCLWKNEALDRGGRRLEISILPRPVVGKDYRIDGNVALSVWQPEKLL